MTSAMTLGWRMRAKPSASTLVKMRISESWMMKSVIGLVGLNSAGLCPERTPAIEDGSDG